jgi:SAM-dependent methyltransferase
MGASTLTAVRQLERAVDHLPPGLRRHVRQVLGRPGPRRVPLEEIDAELDRATALMAEAPDAARAVLDSFVVTLPEAPPDDPFSDAYREWTWGLYRRISGRACYETKHEVSPFDLAASLVRPFPYQTGSPTLVGRDLVARGHVIHCLGKVQPMSSDGVRRVVEFGAGWGNLTQDMIATGIDVTAVEFDEKFCQLISSRCERGPGRISIVEGDMLSFEGQGRFDAAVFFESFHHCADHLSMLGRLHNVVRPGGLVLFAAEPVQRLDYPWGPRLDGLSVWSSRMYGWLELGFDLRYFDHALARSGWTGQRVRVGSALYEADVIVARAAQHLGATT